MFNLNFESDLDKHIENFHKIFTIIKETRIRTLKSVGAMLRAEMSKYIRSEGGGMWKSAHPLTLQAAGRKTPYDWMANLTRFVVDDRGYSVEVGFGNFDARMVRNQPHKVRLSPYLTKVSEEMQRGKQTFVSEKMRRKLGAGRKNKASRVGSDFFPLRKTTNKLIIPARPVSQPVLNKSVSKVENIIRKEFAINLIDTLELHMKEIIQ